MPWVNWQKRIRLSELHTDLDSGQTIISGMGELHLEVIVDRMFREFKVEANVGRPQVAYRETITRQPRRKASMFDRLAVMVNTVMSGSRLRQTSAAKALSLSMPLLAALFRENISDLSKMALERHWKTVLSPAIR